MNPEEIAIQEYLAFVRKGTPNEEKAVRELAKFIKALCCPCREESKTTEEVFDVTEAAKSTWRAP